MAISIGDAVLKLGVDKSGLDKGMKDAEQGVKVSMKSIQQGLMAAGAAFTAVGVAGMKMVGDAKRMNAELGVTALNLGVTTKEMRDLALSTTNVTFPLNEVISSFDLLARAGVTDTEVIKQVATAFDTLGDATGNGAGKVTSIMIPAMKTFRLSAEETADKIDMMTYMTRNSTTSLEDFNTMVGYTSQDMVDAGLTIDDLAAAMMWMSDNGIAPGRVMLREWNKAVTQSQKEGIALTSALGMTNEELVKYKGNLAGATGMAQEYADVANKQYTIIDKVKQKISEFSLSVGSTLEPLEGMFAAMTALGPVMIGMGMILPKLKVAIIALRGAVVWLYAALGPVGLAIIGITTALSFVLPWIFKTKSATDDLADSMSNLDSKMIRTRIEGVLTSEAWEELAKRGHLTEEEFTRLADALDMTEKELFDTMKAAGMLNQTIRISAGDRNVYIRQLEEIKIELDGMTDSTNKANDAFNKLMATIKYEDSAAGHFSLTMYDIYDALDEMGWETEKIREIYEKWGTGVESVEGALEDVGYTANEIAFIIDKLGLKTRDTTRRTFNLKDEIIDTTDKMGDYGDSVTDAIEKTDRWGQSQKNVIEILADLKKAIAEAETSEERGQAILSFQRTRMEEAKRLQGTFGGTIQTALSVLGAPIPYHMRGYQHGGPIIEDTLLMGLKSMRPYAVAHEGERVTPAGQTANIYIMLDGRVIGRAIGQPLVDEIRVKTGVRI